MRNDNSRYRRACVTAVVAALTLTGTALAQTGPQPVDQRQLGQQYDAAVSMYNSPDHNQSADAFLKIIDALWPRRDALVDDARTVLARSLSYRAQVLLDTGRQPEAAAEIARVFDVSPEYVPDASVSSGFAALVKQVLVTKVGWINISLQPSDANVQLDGRTFRGQQPLPVVAGAHFFTVDAVGYERQEVAITVQAGQTSTLHVALERAAPTGAAVGRIRLDIRPNDADVWIDGNAIERDRRELTVAAGRHTVRVQLAGYETRVVTVTARADVVLPVQIELAPIQAPQVQLPSPVVRPPRPRGVPPRVVVIRGSGVYQAFLEPFDSTATFVLYGKPARVDTTYTLGKIGAFHGSEFGATVRVWKHLSIGATQTKIRITERGTVLGTIPHPTLSQSRSVFGVVDDFGREEEAIHLEIGATAGRQHFEVNAYFGPSRMTTTQDVITSLSIREDSSGPAITGATSRAQTAESRIGLNLGVDISALFARYAGIGVALRYVRSDVTFDEAIGGVRKLIAGGPQVTLGVRFRY